MRFNIGSGDLTAPFPWVNVDSFAGNNSDIVADVRCLPFQDGLATRIYCGHLLEHLSLDVDVPKALREIRRVLAPDGVACFVGPCFQRAQVFNDSVLLDCIRSGGDRWPGDRHLWLSTAERSLTAIREVFPLAHGVALTDLEGWPVHSLVGWQFAVIATKE